MIMKQIVLVCATLYLLTACVATEPTSGEATTATNGVSGTGRLTFVANGEDFVRQGFTTVDGWTIQFDHLYVTLTQMTAYQTDPPFDASTGDIPTGASISIAGPITLDLAEGDEDAAPITVDTLESPLGQYNALGWRIIPAAEGDATGATISLVGTAEKDGELVAFTINDSTEYVYHCGEFVGDERKGIVQADGEAEIEATFHFDHIFGDAEAPMDDALNVGALGFDPLAALAEEGQLLTTVTELESALSGEDYTKLVDTLASLGHVGEGHCYEATGGYTGHSE